MNPLTFFRRRVDTRMVDGGRVQCPVRGRDVDVEACFVCGWASTIELDAQPAIVRCRPARVPDLLRVPRT
jgi:hypothetical protein